MKKLYSIFSLCMVFAVLLVMPVSALSGVYDEAEVFSTTQEQELTDAIHDLETQTTDWKFAVVTTNDAQGKSAQTYADDCWDADYHENGALLLLDFDNGEVYISCSGAAMTVYSESRIEEMLDDIFVYIPDKEYSKAAQAFLQTAESYYWMEFDDGEMDALDWLILLFIPLVGGMIAGGIAVGIAVASYRLKFPDRGYEMKEHSQLQLYKQTNTVIGKTVTHRKIPRDDNHNEGGGGTGTHTSSAGRTHSGGGRKM